MIRSPHRPDISLLGPEHAGLHLTIEEFEQAECVDGFVFELIHGVIEVAPAPNPPEQVIATAVFRLLDAYRGPDGSGFAMVLPEPRVFVSQDADATAPQPDVAAYSEFPDELPETYRSVFPVLVVEVVTRGSVDKDYRRNRELYQAVGDILEYWIIDPRRPSHAPSMTVHKRMHGAAPFERVDFPAGAVYEPQRWPGLHLDLARLRRR